jgi:S-adenosylmethionine hydrolase
MSIITLTTDYGLKDYFVGALKGKILSQNPAAVIVDVSHDVDAFNTFEASYIIAAAYQNFPQKTIHIIGVDVEENRENKLVAMRWNNHFFLAADNGILSMLLQKNKPQELIFLSKLENQNSLDVLIQTALLLQKGIELNQLGTPLEALKEVSDLQLSLSQDQKTIKGHVVYIDHFGNAVTNISKSFFETVAQDKKFEIILQNKKIKTILPNYAAIASSEKYPIKYYEGEKLAIFNEAGFLEIAIFRSNPSKVGSAHSLLGLNFRDVVLIKFS